MSDNKQLQKAGDGANQYQAGLMIVQNGIDEKRAREICQEMFNVARKELTTEAYDVACCRVTEFENDLIPKMQRIEGALEKFKEPSFQFLLTEAHRTAAATNRPADYALLSELLIHRIQRGEKRTTVAGIGRAVEIVDEISDDALLALSVAFAVEQCRPVSGNILQGIDVLDDLFGKLCYGELPQGDDWLDHLDILDTVRISTFGRLKKFEDYYAETMNGYCTAGIKKDSENSKIARQILTEASLPEKLLLTNTLNPEYLRLPIVTEKDIDSPSLTMLKEIEEKVTEVPVYLSDDQKDSVRKIYSLYEKDVNILSKVKEQFIAELLKRQNLKKVRDWWNGIPASFSITAVGKVLAHANAKRCDPSLPDLN